VTASTLGLFFPYSAETKGVVVRVAVNYLADQSEPARQRWFWAYHIRLENEGPIDVQLMTRRWLITDGRGARHRVAGEGVVGVQPLIEPGKDPMIMFRAVRSIRRPARWRAVTRWSMPMDGRSTSPSRASR
jgi:hypothetical protein